MLKLNEKKFEAEITKHDYLFLFLTSNNNGKMKIVFPGTERSTSPTNYIYDEYKEDKLIVEIEAIRGRIKNKQFVKNIDDIIHDAKEIIS